MKDKKLVIGAAIALFVLVAGGYMLSSKKGAAPSGTKYAYAADANAWLEIPEGALPDGVKASDIKITKVDASNVTGDGAPLVVYDFQPDGLQFKKPVTLSIKTIAWGDGVPELVLLGKDGAEPVEGTVAVVNEKEDSTVTVRGEITHFSHYALVDGIFHVVTVPSLGNTKVGETFKVPFDVFFKSTNVQDSREETAGESYVRVVHEVKVLEGKPKVSGVYQSSDEAVEPQRVTRPDSAEMDAEFHHSETFTCKSEGSFAMHLDVQFTYKYKHTVTIGKGEDAYDQVKDMLNSDVKKAEFVVHGNCGTEKREHIVMLIIDGKYYPLKQFHVAGPDACDLPHYHAAGKVYGWRGKGGRREWFSTDDPAPKGCGFGKVTEVRWNYVPFGPGDQEEWDKLKAKDAEVAK